MVMHDQPLTASHQPLVIDYDLSTIKQSAAIPYVPHSASKVLRNTSTEWQPGWSPAVQSTVSQLTLIYSYMIIEG
jgi:hypothetical protein